MKVKNCCIAMIWALAVAASAQQAGVVKEIVIRGNHRVSKEAILADKDSLALPLFCCRPIQASSSPNDALSSQNFFNELLSASFFVGIWEPTNVRGGSKIDRVNSN